jgi:hypothetical protein
MSQSINIEIKIEFEMKIWCFSNKIRFNFKNFQISESELIQILKLKSIINVKKTPDHHSDQNLNEKTQA